MTRSEKSDVTPTGEQRGSDHASPQSVAQEKVLPRWKQLLGFAKVEPALPETSDNVSTNRENDTKAKPAKWSLGVLNDHETEEVPGKSQTLRHQVLHVAAQIR